MSTQTEPITWKNVRVKLGDLQPWDQNPRQSTAEQAHKILQSMEQFGQVEVFAIGPDNSVYDGHQRLSTLLAAHGPKYVIDARRSSRPLTEDERKRLVLALHAGATGSWDWDVLSSWNASDLIGGGFDEALLQSMKRDMGALGNLLESEEPGTGTGDAEAQLERAEELRAKWGVERGQLWQIGEHRLYCGDCTSLDEVNMFAGDERMDLVIADPPYSVNYGAKNRALQTIGPANRLTADITGDDLSTEETADVIWGPAFENAYNISRNGTVIYCFSPQGGDQMMMMMMMIKAKWNERLHQLIWRKNSPTFSMGRLDYQYQHEPILYSWRGTNHGYYGDTGRSVIDCDRPSASPLHPTTKPVELLEIFVGNSAKKEQLVFDPFAGSGTTMVACQNLQRRCRAIEISPNYCAVILQRMADAFPGIEIKKLS
jgi:site-specific DNA-methyltransferase (adenine-specific)